MIKFVFLAFILGVAVAVERHPDTDKCEPQSDFYFECNRCHCRNDGNGAICTRKFCIPGEYNDNGVLIAPIHKANKRSVDDDIIIVDEAPKNCQVGKKYKVDCNQCFCSSQGELACTKRKCIQSPEKRSIRVVYPDLPENKCEVGKTYKKDCNTCICDETGIMACTEMACDVDIIYHTRKTRSTNNWGPFFKEGDTCEPGSKFYSECNSCICALDGKSALCTLKMCLPYHEI